MKTKILIIALAFIACIFSTASGYSQIANSENYTATPVTSDTITSDTGYIFTTFRNSTYDFRAKFAGVSAQDTVYVKLQEWTDATTGWTDVPLLDSIAVTGNNTYGFQSITGAPCSKMRYYVNLAAADTVIVVTLTETLKRIY